MGKVRPPASDAEMDVLKALWHCGPSTVRQVDHFLRQRRRRWAYNTVLTLLRRLRSKGYVSATAHGSHYVFRAAVTQAELVRQRLRQIQREVGENSAWLVVEALLTDKCLGAKGLRRVRVLVSQAGRRHARRRTAS